MPDITRREALLVTVGFGSGGALASAIWAGALDSDDQPDGPTAEEETPSSVPTPAESSLRELAAVETIPDGGALDVSAAADEPAYLTRTGDSVRAMSATCTHASCVVAWQAGSRRFECPCHRGAYDAEGSVVSGPPPRPLTELPIIVEAGTVFLEQ